MANSALIDNGILDVFGPVEDTTTDIIKVVGVGGGGCNAVGNMYREGMQSVTFAVCNTDSKSLSVNPVPTKIMLGKSGHGAEAAACGRRRGFLCGILLIHIFLRYLTYKS